MHLLCTSNNLLHDPMLDRIKQPRQLFPMPAPSTITKLTHEIGEILAGSYSISSKQTQFVRNHKVTFRESMNTVHELTDSKKAYIKSISEDLWYSNAELLDMAQVVRLAYLAVNDACGDFDVTNTVQVHRKRVLNSRPEHVAQASRTASQASSRLARLHALLLEEDVASRYHSSLSHDTLWTILQKVMPDEDGTDDESDADDDTDSVGTIDVGEASWDEDLLEASKMVNVFDDDYEDGEVEKEGSLKKSSLEHNSLSRTSWGDMTCPSQLLNRSDAEDSRSITRGPPCGSTEDLSKKTMAQSSSSNCTSYSLRISAEPTGLLLNVTSLSVSEKEPSTLRKESSVSFSNHENIHLGGGKLGPFTPPERKTALNLRSRSSVDTNSVKDAPYPGATSTSTWHQESRGLSSKGAVQYARDNNNSKNLKRPQSIMTLEPTNDDRECFLPNIKRARTTVTTEKGQGGQQGDRVISLPADTEYHCYIADAMISLVRWEFRAHLLPLH